MTAAAGIAAGILQLEFGRKAAKAAPHLARAKPGKLGIRTGGRRHRPRIATTILHITGLIEARPDRGPRAAFALKR